MPFGRSESWSGFPVPEEQERRPIIDEDTYETIASAEATVWSRITVMESEDRWGFFCLRGQDGRAPRWILLEEGGSKEEAPTTQNAGAQRGMDFDEGGWADRTRLGPIAHRLRTLIPKAEPTSRAGTPEAWETAEGDLAEMLEAIRRNERDLLSNKARHALGLLRTLAQDYKAKAPVGSERAQVCRFLRSAVSQQAGSQAQDRPVDLHGLAERWLGIVQPRYVEWKRAKPDNRPVRIKDMEEHLIAEPIETETLRRLAKQTERQEPVGRRLAAAILGLLL
ncbi:MAG: hypothetical protein ABEL51_03410 [Salinibacter sp.]